MDGFDAPQPPTLGSRLRESGISAAETAIAGIGLGARQYVAGAIRGLGRGEQWLDRTLRIPRTPETLAPPPDKVAPGSARRCRGQGHLGDRGLHSGPNGRGGGGGLRERSRGRGLGRRSRDGCGGGCGGRRNPGHCQRGSAGSRRRSWRGGREPRSGGGGRGAGGHRLTHRMGPQRGEPPHGLRGRGGRRHGQRPEPEQRRGMQESGVQQHFAMCQSQRQRLEVIRIDSDSDSALRGPASAASPRHSPCTSSPHSTS